uniref:Uncharacterized protein n=1 Tax=Cacopsylla melanoneura TaxID=428564 RepID=A0A8D9FI28_9HEMI
MINVVVLIDKVNTVNVYYCLPFGRNVSLVNIWNKELQNFERDVDLFDASSKVKNMHGFPIKCLIKNKPPDSVLYRNGSQWVADGLAVNLLLLVSRIMNFTPDVMFPQPDNPHNVDRFGYDISPNMNSLIIGALTLREADLAFGIFSHLLYDSPTTEFSISTAEECFTFAVPAHAGERDKEN